MRVEEDVCKSVVFISAQRSLLDGTIGISFIGTAFIVAMRLKTKKEMSHVYLVTAKHVAESLANKPFLIRINDKKGSSAYVKSDGTVWFYHPADKSIDVAVIPYAPPPELFDCKQILTDVFLSDEIIQSKRISTGDEVFIVGLFAAATGSKRNQPIVRMGDIEMMPDEPIPSSMGNIDAYLITRAQPKLVELREKAEKELTSKE